ncbi:protoheme IX farnesyltransferase [Eremomyces bilateralis CBS 781.70]|uniref:Protoheme IX farnesyltransferase, mitochondrial n=1 Tax=Eremomyces bilateralis CBS 781.70 TaxID=1392243 RepID=A0A6G1GG60_9PEZI|nr:protoheme IX farnesyltransferase [Eremomyces bilateralis CBS 781.70]KAF1816916.1 protoheme IX farnesyltransferase [Eremomyces bilateralis CBS 781.70]
MALNAPIDPSTICRRCLTRLARPRLTGDRLWTRRSKTGITGTSSLRQTFVSLPRKQSDHDQSGIIGGESRRANRDFFLANSAFKELLSGQMKSRESSDSGNGKNFFTGKVVGSGEITRSHGSIGVGDTPTHVSTPQSQDLPHRRRQRQKALAAQQDAEQTAEQDLPADAPSKLTTLSASLPEHSFKRSMSTYLALAKPRLSFLIVLTTTTAYSLYPTPDFLAAASGSPSLNALTLLHLTTGTALCSASANALNMLYEPLSDAKMSRTRNRPLVRNLITPSRALLFAGASALTGATLLALGTNPVVTGLGILNIVVYAGIYTPLKPLSAINTWAGAIVGAIPPLMGWAAAAGECATTPLSTITAASSTLSDRLLDGFGFISGFQTLLTGADSAGGWCLAALLFAWQFPHFNALAHPIRNEYRRAGLRMLAWSNPARNARVSLRYSMVLPVTCIGLTAAGVVSWPFVVLSAPVNVWLMKEAFSFWRQGKKHGSESKQVTKAARGLFWASVWYLPMVLVLAMVTKVGLWDGVKARLARLFGWSDDDELWDLEDDE